VRLLGGLPDHVQAAVACPAAGRLAEVLRERGVEHLAIPGTHVSFRLDPRTTPRGLAALAGSAVAMRSAQRDWRPDVVHANGVRAGLLALGARAAGGAPLVVQVHDNLPGGPLGRAVRLVLAAGADRVIAVSDATARSFDEGLPRPVARHVYISIDHERFRAGGDGAAVRRELGVPLDAPLLGEVAQITPWKGQLVAIEALAALRRRHAGARLVLVGHVAFAWRGVRYDNGRYLQELHERARALGVEDAVSFVGQRADVPDILAALDLFLLPSWDEPFGTAAVEAMACGVVPLVGDSGGVTEYVRDGVSGRVLPAREPERWARAAAELLDDPARRTAMAREATAVAARFTDEAYTRSCLEAYREARGAERTRRPAVRGGAT